MNRILSTYDNNDGKQVWLTNGVPGNVPYVITVGAMPDNYSAADSTESGKLFHHIRHVAGNGRYHRRRRPYVAS